MIVFAEIIHYTSILRVGAWSKPSTCLLFKFQFVTGLGLLQFPVFLFSCFASSPVSPQAAMTGGSTM